MVVDLMVEFEFFSIETLKSKVGQQLMFFGRDKELKKIIKTIPGPKPYFFVSEEISDNYKKYRTQKVYYNLYNKPVRKLQFNTIYEMKFIANQIPSKDTFEADLDYAQRYLIDQDLFSGISIDNNDVKALEYFSTLRYFILDIETEYYGGSNYDKTRPINCVSVYDNFTNKIYTIAYKNDHTKSSKLYKFQSVVKDKEGKNLEFEVVQIIVKDEEELLRNLKTLIIKLDPDVLSGWNVNFDVSYIIKRLEFFKLNPNELSPIGKYYVRMEENKVQYIKISGRSIIDLMAGYKRIKFKQIPSFKLDEIGKNEFGIGKLEYNGWVGDFWKNEFDKFIDYNIRDVEICIAINNQYSIVDFLLNLKRITGCDFSDTTANSKMLDIYILRKCKNNIILPTKVHRELEKSKSVEGGFCLKPEVGVFNDVMVFDMKSLYPSIMLSLNISPETISEDGEIKLPTGINFKKKTGILKEILLDLLGKRDEIRKMLKRPEINNNPTEYLRLYKYQYAYKTFTNSLYGITLFPSFRLYNPKMGASITYTGRFIAHKIKEYCETNGYIVIRQDTDSAFVMLKDKLPADQLIEKGIEIEKAINSQYVEWFKEWGNDTSYLSIKLEKIYESLFSGNEKKLYAGNIKWDFEKGMIDKLDIEIKGFAAKRSDRSLFSRKLQSKLFTLLFEKKSNEDILNYIYKEIDNFYNGVYEPEYIGIPKAITKDLEEYTVSNPWVDGIKVSEKFINGYTYSPKPYLVYIKLDSKYKSNVICFNSNKELPTDLEIDMEKMLTNSVYNILCNILDILHIDKQLVINYIKHKCNMQRSLFGFGGTNAMVKK